MTRYQDELVRLDLTGDFPEHVPHRPLLIVVLDMHLDPCGSRPDVVRDGKPSLPVRRHDRATDVPQDLERLAVRDRLDRNLLDGRGVFEREPLDAGNGRLERCERIAGVNRHVQETSPLYAFPRAPATVRIDIPPDVPVFLGVGVDHHGCSTTLGCFAYLHPPHLPRTAAVPNDDDLALERHTHLLQQPVVPDPPIVCVDQFAGCVTGSYVRCHTGQPALDIRVGIFGNGRFG